MGCWNETCGITQMPIEGGDEVRLFLLVKNKGDYNDDGIIHYTTDLWRPFGMPLKGFYDEYGRIENIQEDTFSNCLLDSLKEILIEVPNRMGDEISRVGLDWVKAIDRLTDEGLKVSNPFDINRIQKNLNECYDLILSAYKDVPKDKWTPFASEIAEKKKAEVEKIPSIVNMYHMMIHEDVYQGILKSKIGAELWGGNGDLKKSLYAGAKQHLEQYRENFPLKKEEEAAIESGDVKTYSRLSMARRMNREETSNKFTRMFDSLDGSGYSGKYFEKYNEFLEQKIEAGAPNNDPEIQELIHQLIGFFQFSRAMMFLRKQWQPQCGKGGQDAEYDLHKYLAKITINFCNKKIKQREE